VVKKALVLVMEENVAEAKIWVLLQETADKGLIISSQMAKDFTRLSDSIHDLALDIPDANKMLKVFTTRAVDDDWMSAPFSRTVNFRVAEFHLRI
jgi:hypothetical protein